MTWTRSGCGRRLMRRACPVVGATPIPPRPGSALSRAPLPDSQPSPSPSHASPSLPRSRKTGGAPKATRARSPRKAAPKHAPRRTSAGRAPQRKAKAPALLATADPTDPASFASFRGGAFARRARAGRCCWPGFAHSARRAARAPSPRRVCGGAACCTRRARRAAGPACGTVGGRAARVHACRRLTTVPRPAAAPRVRHTSRATPWLHPYAPTPACPRRDL